MRTSQCSEGLFFCTSNVSRVHVLLVANLYLLLLHFGVAQTITEDRGKCVVTHRCSKGILYVANSMHCFLL
jgi:hypothetical protein